MNKLKIVLQSRYLFKILCVLCILYSLVVGLYISNKSQYSINEKEFIGKVIQYQIDGNQLKITLKGKEKILIYYYFKTEEEKNSYVKKIELGCILKINGELKIANQNTIPNGFNYYKYLKYHNINYYVSAEKIEIIENNTSVLYYLKNNLISRIDKIDSTGYLRTFIIGDKSLLEKSSIENYRQNGISHLFSISGMHVNLIVGILMFILNKVSYNNLYKYSIITPILLFYLFLTNYGASILRTIIMFIVFSINNSYNLKIKRIDLMLFVLSIAIIINPLIVYDVGFQFSYSISFALIVLHNKISKIKNKVCKNLYISIISFLISFPICIYYYSKVNILGILLNIIMIPVISVVVFPMSLITFIMPFIQPIYKVVIICLEEINIVLSNIKIFELTLSKPTIILVFIYYLIISLTLFHKKYVFILLLVVIIHKNYLYLDNSILFTYLDVGQGDSIFLKLPNNKGNILIDTGGELDNIKEIWKKTRKEYSIVKNKTIPYLETLGITKLNYLIITHGDFDHMGEAINLVENFKVEKVIFNCGDFNELEQELIKVLDKKKIPYYSCIKELNIDNNKLYFLNNGNYNNENDNSSVIYAELNNHKFLFMGDAGVEVEEDLIEKYNLQDIDVLKVGHHGSKTSSSKNFINTIEPKYSIISVGKNNRYGHPNKEVLNILEESKIYRTDQDGSIMFKIKKNKLKSKKCASNYVLI